MGAKNKVIAGDYENGRIDSTFGAVTITIGSLFDPQSRRISIEKKYVDSYEVIDENRTKSAVSAVGRGAVGAFLLGPIGLIAAASAKNKNARTVALHFKDGKNSLIEIDDKIYKSLIKAIF